MKPTVLKLGGSLLDVPDLADRVLHLVDQEQLHPAIVVTGGGRLADVVRLYDEQWGLSADVSHQQAIATMGINAAVLRSLHERFVDSVNPAPQAVGVPAPDQLLKQWEAAGKANLPASWAVTSDSIAAWLAARFGARQLILLKSTDPSADGRPPDIHQLQQTDLVDRWLPHALGDVPQLWWCNLRNPSPQLICVAAQPGGERL
ncbi:MAG: hypothetical protein NXI04_12590 [Planctomycetaceae bacterium]|nr:hypothetical protein [Planctomycetaceae bacterium]